MRHKLYLLLPISLLVIGIFFTFYVDRRQFESGILVCEEPFDQQSRAIELQNRILEHEANFERSLAESPQVENRVAALRISLSYPPQPSSLEALATLSRDNPQNQFAAVQLLSACTGLAGHPDCGNETINRAIELDRDNAVLWSLVSSIRHLQGDSFGATTALQAAAEAAEFDDYFRRGLGMLITAAPVVDDDLTSALFHRFVLYSGDLAIDRFPASQGLFELCSSGLAENQRLADACMDYGERMESQSHTRIGIMLGYSLQSVSYLMLGDITEYQRREQLSPQRLRPNLHAPQVSKLLAHDIQFLRSYLDQMVLIGEQAAWEWLPGEARRLSSQRNYNPCPNVLFGNLLYTTGDFLRWAWGHYGPGTLPG